MNHAFKVLLVLFCISFGSSPLLAGTYCTEGDAREGIRRGAGATAEDFVQGVGRVDVRFTAPDDSIQENQSNGILLDPLTLLCTAHPFKAGSPIEATVIFHPDASLVKSMLNNPAYPGIKAWDSKLKDDSKSIRCIASNLKTDSIKYHPDQDLAIITLEWALEGIPLLPLVLERPIASKPPGTIAGYVVSHSAVHVHGTSKPLPRHRRHLSVLDVSERGIRVADGLMPLYLVKDSMEESKATLKGPRAITNPGDSGAPFILPDRSILALSYGMGFYTDEEERPHALMEFIPLYNAREFIRAISS